MTDIFESFMRLMMPIAQSYYYAGKLPIALAILDRACETCEHAETTPEQLAQLLLEVAKMRATAIFMNTSTEQSVLEIAHRIFELTDNRVYQARADDLMGLAHYYTHLNRQNPDFTVAEAALNRVTFYDVALPIEWHCEWLFHRGLVYQNTDRTEQARACFEEAYQLAESANLTEIQSFAVRHLGFIQQHIDQNLSAARAHFEESLQLREAISLKIYLPFSYQTLGTICMKQGDVAMAETYFERAIGSAREIGNKRALALGLLALGDLYVAQHLTDKAQTAYREVHDIATEIQFEALLDQLKTRMV